ncbi:MAG TPA: DUF2628 domain-containing protein [Acetobacteraceae bacterium]|nr:DUF2628 domain-containing protein [Acetobacteraceae bacterium]
MRIYTAHTRPGRPPVLVREAWSWGAFLFGPFWLLANRAWIATVIYIALSFILAALAPDQVRGLVLFALAVLNGMLGRDLVRWSLARRGYALVHVLAARDEEGALARLLAARADLLENFAEQLR